MKTTSFFSLTLGFALIALAAQAPRACAQAPAPESVKEPAATRALVLAEPGGPHEPYVKAARAWLREFATNYNFQFDCVEDTKEINAVFLARYKVFIQLNYPPYRWTPEAAAAFQDYIENGKGGWIGFHHATLLGEFDGTKMWPWFSEFMGGIRYKNYIASFVSANVQVEDRAHPCMKGIPASFLVAREEFYTYDRSPRPNVHVLASVDEHSYSPATSITMGDHPVVWTNERMKARNVYIFMGHGDDLLINTNYTALFRNSLLWAAGKDTR